MTIVLIVVIGIAAIVVPDLLTRPAILIAAAVGTFLVGCHVIADAIEGRRFESGKRRLLRAVERVK